MTDRELMKMARRALELRCNDADGNEVDLVTPAIKALRDRLAQPEPEPVAWAHPEWLTYRRAPAPDVYYKNRWIPLYTAPPKREWVGLTEVDIYDAMDNEDEFEFARAIEAKLKEKNA